MPFKGSSGGGAASSNSNSKAASGNHSSGSGSGGGGGSQNKSGIPPPDLYSAFPCDDLRDAAIFYFTADAGDYNMNKPLVDAMELVARKTRPPDCIIQGGDNFYPNAGVTKDAVASDFHSWRARWLWGALENVPHQIVFGNHCSPTVHPNPNILSYSKSPENPNGLWRCRGDDPTEEPSAKYSFALPVYGKTSELEDDVAIAKKKAQQEKSKQQRIEEDEKRKEEEIKAANDDDDDDGEPKIGGPSSSTISNSSEKRGEQKEEEEEKEKKKPSKNGNDDDNDDDDDAATTASSQVTQESESQSITSSSANNISNGAVAAANTATPKIATVHHPKTGSKLAGKVHFTVFDTNIASGSVLRRNPEIAKSWPSDCEWLYNTLAEQEKDKALFRIVLAHHPCYMAGQGHYIQGLQLHTKLNKSVSFNGVSKAGLGFENILVRSGVDAYLAGHEHLLHMTEREGGVIHAVAGAGAEWQIYGGKVRSQFGNDFGWEGQQSKRGFLVGCITADLESPRKTVTMTLSFLTVDKPAGSVMYTKSVTKTLQ